MDSYFRDDCFCPCVVLAKYKDVPQRGNNTPGLAEMNRCLVSTVMVSKHVMTGNVEDVVQV